MHPFSYTSCFVLRMMLLVWGAAHIAEAVEKLSTIQGRQLTPAASQISNTIPRILHHLYFPSKVDYKAAVENPNINLRAEWREACRAHHYNWQYYFWDLASAEQFVEQHTPWFKETFDSLPSPVWKGDAFRYVLMKVLGGLYLDLDVECWRDVTPFLEGNDIVLQGFGSHQPAANGMIASRPNHPLWDKILAVVQHNVANGVPGVKKREKILHTVGPSMFSKVLLDILSLSNDPGSLPGKHVRAEYGTITVYPLGQLYIPCEFSWNERGCAEQVAIARALGTQPLKHFAGTHHYSLSWHHKDAPMMRVHVNWTDNEQ